MPEREFKKPVATTNRASVCAMLRAFNSADRLPAFGRLLAEVPADACLDRQGLSAFYASGGKEEEGGGETPEGCFTSPSTLLAMVGKSGYRR
jgi:hypothetical protein